MPTEPAPESGADQLPPASQSNRARQQRSRKNITHPVGFDDENLEKTYNRNRKSPTSNGPILQPPLKSWERGRVVKIGMYRLAPPLWIPAFADGGCVGNDGGFASNA